MSTKEEIVAYLKKCLEASTKAELNEVRETSLLARAIKELVIDFQEMKYRPFHEVAVDPLFTTIIGICKQCANPIAASF